MNGTWLQIADELSRVTEKQIQFIHKKAVFGGDINQAWKVTDSANQHWFIKTNRPELLPMFKAEAKGLEEITDTNTIRAPKSYCHGITDEFSYLVLEHIEFSPLTNLSRMGEQLAKMHEHVSSNTSDLKQIKPFGWSINNTIGSTPQSNKRYKSWPSFYKNERLLYQLKLAKKNNYPSANYEDGLLLADKTHEFFKQYTPQPSLLHGDLWGGNCASDSQGSPVIFDPATYYGDRESDLAMTELFGGFGADFYASYIHHYPLDQDYKIRKNLYNLYHVLNHYNLFGSSYAVQAANMTKKLLSEI